MSSFVLKLLALLCMISDHIGVVFNIFLPIDLLPQDVYLVLRAIGRAALPLYALVLVEAFRHTRSVPLYSLRVFGMGVLIQLGYAVATFWVLQSGMGGGFALTYLNIFLTLTLGIALLAFLRAGESKAHPAVQLAARLVIFIALFAAVTQFTPIEFDYGIWALVLIAGLYLAPSKYARAACIALWGIVFYWGTWPYIAATLLAAAAPILYNGKRGPNDHRLFYWAYPVHLLALYGIALLVI